MPLATTSGVAPKMERISGTMGRQTATSSSESAPPRRRDWRAAACGRPHLAGAGGAGDEREVAHREAHEEDL